MVKSRSLPFWKMVLLAIAAAVVTGSCVTPRQVKASKRCVECHPEQKARLTAQPHVHLPVQEGRCESCHYVHGVIGGPMVKEKGKGLCYSCHPQDNLEGGAYVHTPLKKGEDNCLSCHQAHASTQEKLLKGKGKELCLTCHEKGPFSRPSLHKPLEEGCGSCHAPHSSPHPYQLVAPPATLCLTCHDPQGANLKASHRGLRLISGESCSRCHNPHSSTRQALLREVVHPSLEDCLSCHPGGDPSLNGKKVADLCGSCHEPGKAQSPSHQGVPRHPKVGEGKCLDCHSPHATDFQALLVQEEGKVCLSCHPKLEVRGKLFPHAPLKEGKCTGCHASHSSSSPQGLLLKPWKELCFSCHKDLLSRAEGDRYRHLPFAQRQCEACHDPHIGEGNKLLKRELTETCAGCHPKLQAELKQGGGHLPFRKGQCTQCHSPHSSNLAYQLQRPADKLCLSCHEGLEKAPGDGGKVAIHSPFKEGECLRCHRGHTSSQPHLLAQAEPELCLGCHYDTAPKREAFKGSHLSREAGGMRCTECHEPHQAAGEQLLYPVRHQPFARKECQECHGK